MSHVITSWHAYKIDGSNAELTVLGEGFGEEPGAVKIIVKGAGNSYPQIKKWCDTVIVTEAPVDSEVMVVFVDIPDSKGKKDRSRTAPGEQRESTGATPDFLIVDVNPTPDSLVLDGNNLDLVDQVILYDEDAPPLIVAGDFVEDTGDLIVEWPTNFSGELEKLRAVQNPDKVQEVLAGPGGWSPAEPGLIQFAAGSRDVSGDILVTLSGIGFGTVAGDVFLSTAAGETQALIVSWTDSAVVVTGAPKEVYTGVRLVDANAVEADVAPSAPIPFKTPGLMAVVSTVTQVGENPEVIRLTGTNLDQVASGDIVIDGGNSIEFFSDDPAFYDTAAAANNAANGVASVTIAPGQVDVTAANDVSGQWMRTTTLKDLNGSTNVAENFPDVFLSGIPGNPTSVINFASTKANLSVDADPYVEVFGANLLPNPIKVNALDSGASGVTLTEIAGSTGAATFARVGGAVAQFGERYTGWTFVDNSDAPIDVTSLDPTQYFQMPGAQVTTGLGQSSPGLRQVQLQGDGLADASRIQIFVFDPAINSNQGFNAYITPGNIRWTTWSGSYASENDYITTLNGNAGVLSAAATPGLPDTVLLQLDTTIGTFGNPDPSGLDIVFMRAFYDGANYNTIFLNAISGGDAPLTIQ
jgi:hypothetical protein